MRKFSFSSGVWSACFVFLVLTGWAAESKWQPAVGPLKTRWDKDVSAEQPLPEYPRPQMVRKEWLNLNGVWDLAIVGKDASQPQSFEQKILVPFPVESALSGVMKLVGETNRLWYRREFTVPKAWKGKDVLLHFGAADWETEVYVNGKKVGEHRGGYDPFSVDVTKALKSGKAQELVVAVWDPTDAGGQPRGKQINKPHGIFYTPCSGIWQTVWLEPVPTAHIDNLKITPDVDGRAVKVEVTTTDARKGMFAEVLIYDGRDQVNGMVLSLAGNAQEETKSFVLPIAHPKLWSPETPFLYEVKVALLTHGAHGDTTDDLKSYFAMRKISLDKDDHGITRIFLNNKPYFMAGPLDQGFWPDGIYTAPTDDALRYDIEMTKKVGFNMTRKHVKVEPDRWYYWCDKLGLLVWQDMPSGNNKTAEDKKEYEDELRRLVETHWNHPSIIMWVVFNEGWGQFDTERLTKFTKELDPSRLVNNASGWTDKNVGNIVDMHKYPGPGMPPTEPTRASVLGEFGGLGLAVPGHTWTEKSWGYQGMADASVLTERYANLFRGVWGLKDEGLSAAVYTQITDVETECNGLLTYDREVLKPRLEKICDANLGKLPPLPRKIFVAGTAEQGTNMWRYTFQKPNDNWFKVDYDDANWKSGRAGFGTKGTPGAIVKTVWDTSDIWIRREFEIQALPKNPRLIMHHDEDAEVYVNGIMAAQVFAYISDYQEFGMSPQSAAGLHVGRNVMAVHCHQKKGGQYIDVGIEDGK